MKKELPPRLSALPRPIALSCDCSFKSYFFRGANLASLICSFKRSLRRLRRLLNSFSLILPLLEPIAIPLRLRSANIANRMSSNISYGPFGVKRVTSSGSPSAHRARCGPGENRPRADPRLWRDQSRRHVATDASRPRDPAYNPSPSDR